MAFVPSLRRGTGWLMAATMLVACSGSGLTPPGDIDSRNTVSAIAPVSDTGGQADVFEGVGAESSAVAGDVAFDGADTGIVSASETAMTSTSRRTSGLPMIDSDEAMGVAGLQPAGADPLAIPEEGVNMDAALGAEPIQGLAAAQAEEIAEGTTSQVAVDGIGSDNPQQIGTRAVIPLTEAADDLVPQADDTVLRLPDQESRRRPIAEEEREVAFIPRIADPMAVPESFGGMPAAEKSCRQRLRQLGVKFRDIPRISRGKSCGIDYPIELTGLSGGIAIKPAASVNCQITEAFAKWVKNELAPAVRFRYVGGISAIHQMSSYSCRTMNSRRGNPMSEHAKGNAIDVGRIALSNGKAIKIESKGFFAFREKGLLKAVRSDSCKYFTTVLGPGSDRYHKDHFHFDLRARKKGGRYCSL
ncbi:extensin family protein [Rhizobium sp. TRM95111]|uniref:extensin-like domain-containing protein n=1 Tax=Rhizobium alarense TaxID=2846851 RepID=UPI001F18D304|nr:extensin family protein [Rhizobium alarense]MCF3639891.1 extensin family protein [Rhizobium alarense]